MSSETCQDFSHTPIACFRLFQGRGPKGKKKKFWRPPPSPPPSLSHGLDPPMFRTLLYLLHPPPRSDELALYRELPTPPTSGWVSHILLALKASVCSRSQWESITMIMLNVYRSAVMPNETLRTCLKKWRFILGTISRCLPFSLLIRWGPLSLKVT